jgi:serine phosphatase RsbU (regulator of sigma subunit)
VFALFSDGIVESTNASDEQFGVERIAGKLAAAATQPVAQIVEGVIAEAAAHGASDDDRSILVIRVL